MGARLNKKEREIYERVIKEELKRKSSSLRIVWELITRHNQRRHTQHEMVQMVRRMIKKGEG